LVLYGLAIGLTGLEDLGHVKNDELPDIFVHESLGSLERLLRTIRAIPTNDDFVHIADGCRQCSVCSVVPCTFFQSHFPHISLDFRGMPHSPNKIWVVPAEGEN